MEVRIRLGEKSDLSAITTIYNQSIALRTATAHTEPVTIEERSAWFAAHSPADYPVFVAESNNTIVGYSCFSPYRPGRMALRSSAEISFYVHEEKRRKGIGDRLLDHAINQAPDLSLRTLFAIVLDINPASIALLEKYRFEQWGHLPRIAEIDGRECGHLYYGLRVCGENS